MMINPTDRQHLDSTRTQAESRRVLWLEIPQRRDPAPAPREPWYDPAALYEEAERWDGMA